jgi:hypothetical protein
MKDGTTLFFILASLSFVSCIISFSSFMNESSSVDYTVFLSAVIAFLQTIAWILVGYMYENR